MSPQRAAMEWLETWSEAHAPEVETIRKMIEDRRARPTADKDPL